MRPCSQRYSIHSKDSRGPEWRGCFFLHIECLKILQLVWTPTVVLDIYGIYEKLM